MLRQNTSVTLFDPVAGGLSNAMYGQDGRGQIMASQQVQFLETIIFFRMCLLYVEVIAQAAQFQALITPLRRSLSQFLDGEVLPLSAKQDDLPSHTETSINKGSADRSQGSEERNSSILF
jgi:hypothetical protein